MAPANFPDPGPLAKVSRLPASAVDTLRAWRGSVHNGKRIAIRSIARNAFGEALVVECERRDTRIARRDPLPIDCTPAPSEFPFRSLVPARIASFSEQRFGPDWFWSTPTFQQQPDVGDAATETDDGRSTRIDLVALRLTARVGAELGILGAMVLPDGNLRYSRTTAVWSKER